MSLSPYLFRCLCLYFNFVSTSVLVLVSHTLSPCLSLFLSVSGAHGFRGRTLLIFDHGEKVRLISLLYCLVIVSTYLVSALCWSLFICIRCTHLVSHLLNTFINAYIFIVSTHLVSALYWSLLSCIRCTHLLSHLVNLFINVCIFIVSTYLVSALYWSLFVFIRCTHLVPPQKLFGSGFSTPYTPFCLMCTISSELKYILGFTHLSEPGLISAGLHWTGSTPAGFQESFRAVSLNFCNLSLFVYPLVVPI